MLDPEDALMLHKSLHSEQRFICGSCFFDVIEQISTTIFEHINMLSNVSSSLLVPTASALLPLFSDGWSKPEKLATLARYAGALSKLPVCNDDIGAHETLNCVLS